MMSTHFDVRGKRGESRRETMSVLGYLVVINVGKEYALLEINDETCICRIEFLPPLLQSTFLLKKEEQFIELGLA